VERLWNICIRVISLASSSILLIVSNGDTAYSLTVLAFSFEYFLFIGWLTLADALGNPFREWPDEFEWENYVKTTVLSSFSISSGILQEGATPLADSKETTEELRRKLFAYFQNPESADDLSVEVDVDVEEAQSTSSPVEKIRKAATGF